MGMSKRGKGKALEAMLGASSVKSGGSWSWTSHNHKGVPYLLPNGSTVYASGHHSYGHRTPDFGYYFDGMWKPETIAFHIGWKDYGLPLLPFHQVSLLVNMAIEQANGGAYVECGCIGGHGRTGTFLALLTLEAHRDLKAFASAHAASVWAIGTVRREYCRKAVETEEQEDYVWEYARRLLA